MISLLNKDFSTKIHSENIVIALNPILLEGELSFNAAQKGCQICTGYSYFCNVFLKNQNYK